MGPALLCFAAYSIGFPAFNFYTVKKYKLLIKEDQLLRAADIGDDPVTNPRAFFVRKRYHKLYYHFKPGKVYWIVYIILRKFGIAGAGLMFRGNPGFQLSVILLVLFISFVLQVQNRPYMSSAEKDVVIHQHKVKAERGDPYHKIMAERMRVGKSYSVKEEWRISMYRTYLSSYLSFSIMLPPPAILTSCSSLQLTCSLAHP